MNKTFLPSLSFLNKIECYAILSTKHAQSFELLNIYELMPGPTSFAPIIEMATTIVEESRGQYHVLLIIADGQVIPRFLVMFEFGTE